ncbi:MAG: Gfo/Idh/MocA family oxidoreductase [Betaproteobacteria bacterium]
MSGRRLRVGVAGLGRAFTLMLPTFTCDSRVKLVAAADPRSEARLAFAADFGGRVHETVEALCADDSVEVVYIATPHPLHAEHAALAAAFGKHILVEKPMALTLEECAAMIDAAARAHVTLIIGHSHSFDAPIALARAIIESGAVGAVTMIQAQCYTDFLYRLRRPDELATERGGGVVYSQAAHQVDIVRLLAGGRVRSVRALTGAWDASRPTEGAYAALLAFDDGAYASLVYSGYAHFDSDEFCGGTSELGALKPASHYGSARRGLAALDATGPERAIAEAQAKARRGYGGATHAPAKSAGSPWHEHFGSIIVSCERADLRPLPTGVMVYGDADARMHPLPRPAVPRAEVIDELYAAIVDGVPALHDGRWGMATHEVCLGMLRSAREGRDVAMRHQVALRAR